MHFVIICMVVYTRQIAKLSSAWLTCNIHKIVLRNYSYDLITTFVTLAVMITFRCL